MALASEERQLLTGLFDRIRGAASTSRDPEAEGLIQDAVKAQPYAPYYLAQTVLVQDQALRAANDRLQELEGKVRDLENRAGAPRAGGFLSGLGSLFGGAASAPPRRPAAPPPSPPPGSGWNQPSGAWQQPPAGGAPQQPQQPWGSPSPGAAGGGGFLKGALGTAAGVAGGVLLADSIRGLFAGHNNPLGIGTGFAGPGFGGLGGETIVNNYYGNDPGANQWDAAQDAQQDAADDAQSYADAQQDADQDQDDFQDASDFGSDFGSDDGSYDT
ncbi:MAG TPA: DUF2076 domain-containing protein [Methylocella sp.]|nr:DUF2076 domain-containing protein [Methylocella sp.]